MSRQHKKVKHTCSTTPCISDSTLPEWLEAQAHQHQLQWLLAHTDPGVIWGEMREQRLSLSSKAFSSLLPSNLSLDWETLQQARLFGEAGEMLLWHDGVQWQSTLQRDFDGTDTDCLDESYFLWGYSTDSPDKRDGFYLLKEGTRGIQHTPPVNATARQRASLCVRHYLHEDSSTGLLYVAASRLVKLKEGAAQ
jgi:CRISPR-associated protein (TIGR03984 family)